MQRTASLMARAFPKSPVYTRTGDAGTSSLFSGERRRKDDALFDALGAADELNAHMGVAAVELSLSVTNRGENLQRLIPMIEQIQSRLLDVGSAVATPVGSASPTKLKRAALPTGMVEQLELWIDELDAQLPPLTNFILPGGVKSSAALHVARTVCRRLERTLWTVQFLEAKEAEGDATAKTGPLDDQLLKYVNRLSDWLFVAARFACMCENGHETVYKKAQ